MQTRLGAFLLLIVGVVVSGVVALGAVQHIGPAAMLFSSECSLGLAGTALSITVEGPEAEQWCAAEVGTTAASGATWYRYDADETLPGVLICRHDWQGNTITVRDQGALMLYGSEACSSIQASTAALDTSLGRVGSGGGTSSGGAGSNGDDEGVPLEVDSDRYNALMMEGVCLLTTEDEAEYVSIYTVGEEARTYCEGLIELGVGGRDDWRIAQGYNGTGHQPPRICVRDYDGLIVQVFDTAPSDFGQEVCDSI